MVSEPCGRGAGVLSPQRDAPVTASGCKQQKLPQHRGFVREGRVNQGGTTEDVMPPSLQSLRLVRTGAFFHAPVQGRVRKGAVRAAVHNREQ